MNLAYHSNLQVLADDPDDLKYEKGFAPSSC